MVFRLRVTIYFFWFYSLSIRLCSIMGTCQWHSKEDQTMRISKSVFVTNFPETCSTRDLWKVCNDYGTVVDVFIPVKKLKAGNVLHLFVSLRLRI